MEHNDRFSFDRFGRVLSTDLRGNMKKYFMFALFLLLVMMVFIVWAGCDIFGEHAIEYYHRRNFITATVSISALCYVAFAWFTGARFMKDFTSKSRALESIMLPASQSEKYLERLLIDVVGFNVLYILLCIVAVTISGSMMNIIFNAELSLSDVEYYYESSTIQGIGIIVLSMLLGQSFMVLGSTVFPNRGLVYTPLCLGGVGLCYFFGVSFVIALLHDVHFLTGNTSLNEDAWALNTLMCVIALATVVNYVVAYVRYRECEIINRW